MAPLTPNQAQQDTRRIEAIRVVVHIGQALDQSDNHWSIYLLIRGGGSVRANMATEYGATEGHLDWFDLEYGLTNSAIHHWDIPVTQAIQVDTDTTSLEGALVAVTGYDEVIEYCLSCDESQLLGGGKYGNRVVRISDTQVVKFGRGVSYYEAVSQHRALGLVDAQIVRIPRVQRFLSDKDGRGYMVMEFVTGEIHQSLTRFEIERVAAILQHLSTITSSVPGSLGGGPSTGLLWPETNDLFINTLSDIEDWFNSRLFPEQGLRRVTLQHSKFILCHLDIAPRNLIWQDDGSVYLLDWASAGFYPRLLEFVSQWITEGKDGNFHSMLLQAMVPLSDADMEQKAPICQALYNTQKYSFHRLDLEPLYILPIPPLPNLAERESQT
uniref:Ribonuclease 3 n=1 Tax=Talaromyces marneffei PM1 TaxID=1077442 RepID=A0A093VZM0_TALMA